MQIDLDRPVVVAVRHNRWVVLGLLAVASLLIGGAVSARPAADAKPVPASRVIAFEVQGNGRADFAAVWTRTQAFRYVPSSSVERYADPATAVLTVRAAIDGTVTCRIRVDGAITDERLASFGQSATCVWVAGPERRPEIVDS